MARKLWQQYGYARLDDHARERFQRSGRWIRNLAAIGRAIDDLPGFLDALTGDDGGAPLSLAAARTLAGHATPDTAGEWIELARSVSVRRLREVAASRRTQADERRAVAGEQPEKQANNNDGLDGRQPDGPATTEAQDDCCILRFTAPLPTRPAFDEALQIFRAVEGCELPVASFIEALLAESLAGGLVGHGRETAPLSERTSSRRDREAAREKAFEAATRNWRDLRARDASQGVSELEAVLQDDGGDDRALRTLLGMRGRIERELDRVLVRMARLRVWPALGFAGLEQYAEERLGLSRSTARERASLHRGLELSPELRAAYEAGKIGSMAALEVVRLLRREPGASAETRRAWVERARQATVKRLRDEVRALQRLEVDQAGAASGTSDSVYPAGACRPDDADHSMRRAPLRPLSDEEWHCSLSRRTGDGRARVARLAAMAHGGDWPMTTVSWRLPADLAARFASAMRQAARTSSRGEAGGNPPLWAGLLAMLEDFVGAWDVDQTAQRPSRVAIYVRDGWRCMAPGCTSRRNLEDHHVLYRSHGGDDSLDNRVCLCRFHHQRGEHGDLARVRGRAPLALRWSLGQVGRGGVFHNEIRLFDRL